MEISASITGLQANKKYYVRAYAKTSTGILYGNEVNFIATSNGGNTVTDIDDNVYHTVQIGTQTWMVENLKVTKYRNGDIIPQVTDQTQWGNLTTGAWCYYSNDPGNNSTYGKLYNWYAVNDPRGLAPNGWHIPSDGEWTILENYLGGASVAGGQMKSISLWTNPNTGATNSSGFTGLPTGTRQYDFTFSGIGVNCYMWSTTDAGAGTALCRILNFNSAALGKTNHTKYHGFSIRCVKD